MKAVLSKKEACAWRRRWQNVARAERDELRRTPPSLKYRQLAALASGAPPLFAEEKRSSRAIDRVRARWRLLRKKALHG